MMKHAESVFFLLATVVALALPAVPALQEAFTADYATVEAAAPAATMQQAVASSSLGHSSWQVTAVR